MKLRRTKIVPFILGHPVCSRRQCRQCS